MECPLHARNRLIVPRLGRLSVGLTLGCFLFFANETKADHDLDIYSVDDVFVYDLLIIGGREINFVVMQDSLDLFVISRVQTSSKYPLSSYGHYESNLLISFHDRLEIYDLSDPSTPVLFQILELRSKRGKPIRWPEIAKIESAYYLVAVADVFELHPPMGDGAWALDRLEFPPAVEKNHIMDKEFPSYIWGPPDKWPFVVRTTDSFRWEVGRRLEEDSNYRKRVKFLWKIRRDNEEVVSSLILGEVYLESGKE